MSGSGISVIIPCHNAGPWLAQTLGSLLAQSLPPEQVIVVDDGSTDGSRAVAESFGAAVTVIPARCGSASATRNLGMGHATGRFLMFLDADDVLDPAALEAMAEALDRAPGGIALCPWQRMEQAADGRWMSAPPSCAPRRSGQDPLAAWLTGWYHPPCSVLWSRRAHEITGAWDPKAGCNDDGERIMRAMALGVPVVEADGGGAWYRRLPQSFSGTRRQDSGLTARLYTLEKIAGLLEDRGRLRPYRPALAEALAAVAADCGPQHAEIRARVRAVQMRMGAPRPWAPALERVARVLRRPQAPAEVTFGLAPVPVDAPPEGPSPEVSIILPTHNRADTLPRALESVFAQSVSDWELLVIDDGSTDGTAALLAAHAADTRLRVLRQPVNAGAAAARNRGLRAARGRFVAFLDSDDAWFPDTLARQLAAFRAAPPATGLVFGRPERIDAAGRRHIEGLPQHGDVFARMLERNVVNGTPGTMIRRSVVDAVGLFDEGMPAAEDYDYWLRVTRRFPVAFIDAPLFRWYDDDSAASARLSRDLPANLAARDRLYAKHGAAMRQHGTAVRFLLTSAQRRLRHPGGDGVKPLLTALRLRPVAPLLWAWLGYALLPAGLRKALRGARSGTAAVPPASAPAPAPAPVAPPAPAQAQARRDALP